MCAFAGHLQFAIGGIHQQGNAGYVWGNLPEELDALGAKYILVEEDAGHMPAGAVQTLDQSKADRVAAIVKTTGTVLLASCAARAEAT
jgi:hypothetical protein